MDLQSLTLQELQAVHPNIRLAANELGLSHISDTSLTQLVAPAATVDANGRYVLDGLPLGTVAWYKTEPVNTYGLGSGGGNTVDLSGIKSEISALQEASTKTARIEAVQALQAALDGNVAADATLKQQVDALAASIGNVSSKQLKASVDKLLADVAALQAGGGGGGAQAGTGPLMQIAYLTDVANTTTGTTVNTLEIGYYSSASTKGGGLFKRVDMGTPVKTVLS